jgi:hypothetical protein
MKVILKTTKVLLIITIFLIFVFQLWGIYIFRSSFTERTGHLGNFKNRVEKLKCGDGEGGIRPAAMGDIRSTCTFESA